MSGDIQDELRQKTTQLSGATDGDLPNFCKVHSQNAVLDNLESSGLGRRSHHGRRALPDDRQLQAVLRQQRRRRVDDRGVRQLQRQVLAVVQRVRGTVEGWSKRWDIG